MVLDSIKHQIQQKHYWCGNACYSMLLGIDQKQAAKECKTTYKGTSTLDVLVALRKRGLLAHFIHVHEEYDKCCDWLSVLSLSWPLYLSGEYGHNGLRGRTRTRHHAILAIDGKIYDPSESYEIDIECYAHTYDKYFNIDSMIIIEQDRLHLNKTRQYQLHN